jgi:pimeloyl-ACP methyl ester carboxylesterase/class 3 adenylate cyclase
VEIPETRYAENGGLKIAYQIFGDGPLDIMHVSNWVWAVDLIWDFPHGVRWLSELADIGRVTQFDMPGTGSSDPFPEGNPVTLEAWMDTLGFVLDAAGIERAALVAQDFGGMMAMLFAAAHPERVSALVLVATTARLNEAPDYPIGYPEATRDAGIEWWLRAWGTGTSLHLTAPSIAGDDQVVRLQSRYERLVVPPATARQVFSLVADLDVRSVLPSIRVPTLVIHRRGDRWIPVAQGRYLAEQIPDARYVELPGEDHMPFAGDTGLIAKEIRHFLGAAKPEQRDGADRVLATVLFTDIVSSTERAAELGDRQWKELLDAHDRMVRGCLEEFRGREIKTTGDGFLAAFDGPGKAVNCASAIRDGAQRLGVPIRAGLHVGEVERRGEDIGGIAVHVASRVMSNAASAEILVSSTVKDLVIGSGIEFDDRGAHELKGVPGEWHLYAVAAA